jgi:hypothetical protein
MHASAILALGAATLAAAAPAANKHHAKNEFSVTNFSFGCTGSCYWSFNLTVPQVKSERHPLVLDPVTCSGNLDQDTDYILCDPIPSSSQVLKAYVVKATNELKLLYQVNLPELGERYVYEGETEVYSATGNDAAKQKENFVVVQNKVTMESA